MPLTTLANVQALPNMGQLAVTSAAWLNQLIAGADAAIKAYLKRDIEQQCYVESYNGINQTKLIIKQYPILAAQTTIAVGSAGQALPQSTINVTSTAGFPSGPGAGTANPTIAVQVGNSSFSAVTYMGTTTTSFTGCAGGAGTLSSAANQNLVYSPAVWLNNNATYGQGFQPFTDAALLTPGNQYSPVIDGNKSQSNRGLIVRCGGYGGLSSFGCEYGWQHSSQQSKLSASQLPVWPWGYGNIQVAYTAGFASVPADISMAATMLVAQMVRIMPNGADMASENLGAYSYSILNDPNNPTMGSIKQLLARHRESSWGIT